MKEKNFKNTCKDTVFTKLFGAADKQNLLELYLGLHPDDVNIGTEDLEIVTIDNVFTNDVYNDLGFLVKNKLIVLVEAQSTWSVNILIRMFIYLARTYRDYIYSDNFLKKKLYSENKLSLPKPELFVFFTGEDTDIPSELSFRKEFFANEDIGFDFKVNIISADPDRKDIIGQYIMFCKVHSQQVKLYGRTMKAIKETIRICKESGYLKDYISKHEMEVTDMFLGSKEEIEREYREMLIEEAREKAIAEGLAEGLEKGLAEGLEKGLAEGLAEGELKNKIEVYNKCLEDGLSKEKALFYSGLSKDEIPEQ